MKDRHAKKHQRIRETQRDVDAAIDNHPFFDGPRGTMWYLERVRDLIAAERGRPREFVSKYAIAQRLGIAPNRISLYQLHGGTMDNKLAYRVAELLNDNPLRVIANIEAERSRREADKSFWTDVAKKVAMVLGVIAGALIAHMLGGFSVEQFAFVAAATETIGPVYYVKWIQSHPRPRKPNPAT